MPLARHPALTRARTGDVAVQEREAGNAAFRAGRLHEAEERYTAALLASLAAKERSVVLSNRAFARIRLAEETYAADPEVCDPQRLHLPRPTPDRTTTAAQQPRSKRSCASRALLPTPMLQFRPTQRT